MAACSSVVACCTYLERKSYKIIPRMPGGPHILKKLFWFWTTFAAVPDPHRVPVQAHPRVRAGGGDQLARKAVGL